METNRLNSGTSARIAYVLGQTAQHELYPVSHLIKVTTYSKEDVCRVARMCGMPITKHKGVWYERERQIDDIIATEFNKKNRS